MESKSYSLTLKYFHYELNQSLDSVKALILFERVASCALSHRPRTWRAICLQLSGPKLHRGNISIMHLVNGENGKIIGAYTFSPVVYFSKKCRKEFIKIGLTYLMSFVSITIEVLMAGFDNHLVHVIHLARSRE